ncbi:MAG TPA: fused response regulator/phosphatase [Thiothrix sp.]|nr:fused response regulator/phosphatase [Thiothrix sp.]
MNILVVDDARDMRLIAQHLLRKLGYHADTAQDGQEAWEKLQKKDYQIVISDWVMPNIDGLSLCQKIRAANFPHYIYIVLLTGMSGKQNLISGIDAGADDFATKPVELEELNVRLRSAKRVLELESSLAQKNKSLQDAHALIEKDLQHASQTQLSVLPEPLKHEKCTTAWLFKPAIFVGGDTFNYYFVSADLLVFFTIDISGHGVSSAMISMSLQFAIFQTTSLYGGDINEERLQEVPRVFAENLNKMMLNDKSEHYLTMIFGIADLKNKKIHYVQAGHPYPFIYRKAEQHLEMLSVNGFPIGLFDLAQYETQTISFNSGDKFIVYSDGISENKSALNQTLLESDNLQRHFQEICHLSTDDMMSHIKQYWLTHEQINHLPDDISVLAFEFH